MWQLGLQTDVVCRRLDAKIEVNNQVRSYCVTSLHVSHAAVTSQGRSVSEGFFLAADSLVTGPLERERLRGFSLEHQPQLWCHQSTRSWPLSC